jgi:hypothetical protein
VDNTPVKFDIIGFDACLMAMYEVAAALHPYARYLLASQLLEPGHGWDYNSLGDITIASTVSPGSGAPTAIDVGTVFINGYMNEGREEASSGLTLALVDLTTYPQFISAVTNAANQLTTLLRNNASEQGPVGALGQRVWAAQGDLVMCTRLQALGAWHSFRQPPGRFRDCGSMHACMSMSMVVLMYALLRRLLPGGVSDELFAGLLQQLPHNRSRTTGVPPDAHHQTLCSKLLSLMLLPTYPLTPGQAIRILQQRALLDQIAGADDNCDLGSALNRLRSIMSAGSSRNLLSSAFTNYTSLIKAFRRDGELSDVSGGI